MTEEENNKYEAERLAYKARLAKLHEPANLEDPYTMSEIFHALKDVASWVWKIVCVLWISFVLYYYISPVAKRLYHKSPTLQNTVNTPVQIINEISK